MNIVEGYSRHSTADRLHFLQIALSSLAEVGYCLHAAKRKRLEYLDDKAYERFDMDVRQAAAPLRGLMKSLGREHP